MRGDLMTVLGRGGLWITVDVITGRGKNERALELGGDMQETQDGRVLEGRG